MRHLSTRTTIAAALAVLLLLLQAEPARSAGAPVVDAISNAEILKIFHSLLELNKQYSLLQEKYKILKEQFRAMKNIGAMANGYTRAWDIAIGGRGCGLNQWNAVLNAGAAADSAIDDLTRRRLWTCDTLANTPEELRVLAKLNDTASNIARDAFETSGISHKDQLEADILSSFLINRAKDTGDVGGAPTANAQKAAAGTAGALALIRDMERTNAALVEVYAMILAHEKQLLDEGVVTYDAYEKIKKTLWQANMDTPYSGI